MNKLFTVLLATCMLACGADDTSPLDNDVLLPEDNVLPAEYAELEQAITFQEGMGLANNGQLPSPPGSGGRCFSTDGQQPRCFLPTDKKVRFRYTGTQFNSWTPNVDYKWSFGEAVRRLKVQNGTPHNMGWDIGSTTSPSNENVTLGDIDGCSMAVAIPTVLGAVTVGGPEGTYRKFNGCSIVLSPANTSICFNSFNNLSAVDQTEVVVTTFMHEMVHCMGLGHTNSGLMVTGFTSIQDVYNNQWLSSGDVSLLKFYQP